MNPDITSAQACPSIKNSLSGTQEIPSPLQACERAALPSSRVPLRIPRRSLVRDVYKVHEGASERWRSDHGQEYAPFKTRYVSAMVSETDAINSCWNTGCRVVCLGIQTFFSCGADSRFHPKAILYQRLPEDGIAPVISSIGANANPGT